MVNINPTVSIITLNVNGIKHQLKERLSDWTLLYVIYKKPTLNVRHVQIKGKYRKIYYANTNQKKGGVAMLISDRTEFKARGVIRDKGHYITLKMSIL